MTKFQLCWFYAGVGWILLVVYLSLANMQIPQGPVQWGDKANHFLAYGFLMGWFGQLYRHPVRIKLAIVVSFLGILMELIQARLPYRWFDVMDAIANIGGVLVAYCLLHLGADKLTEWFERRYF